MSRPCVLKLLDLMACLVVSAFIPNHVAGQGTQKPPEYWGSLSVGNITLEELQNGTKLGTLELFNEFQTVKEITFQRFNFEASKGNVIIRNQENQAVVEGNLTAPLLITGFRSQQPPYRYLIDLKDPKRRFSLKMVAKTFPTLKYFGRELQIPLPQEFQISMSDSLDLGTELSVGKLKFVQTSRRVSLQDAVVSLPLFADAFNLNFETRAADPLPQFGLVLGNGTLRPTSLLLHTKLPSENGAVIFKQFSVDFENATTSDFAIRFSEDKLEISIKNLSAAISTIKRFEGFPQVPAFVAGKLGIKEIQALVHIDSEKQTIDDLVLNSLQFIPKASLFEVGQLDELRTESTQPMEDQRATKLDAAKKSLDALDELDFLINMPHADLRNLIVETLKPLGTVLNRNIVFRDQEILFPLLFTQSNPTSAVGTVISMSYVPSVREAMLSMTPTVRFVTFPQFGPVSHQSLVEVAGAFESSLKTGVENFSAFSTRIESELPFSFTGKIVSENVRSDGSNLSSNGFESKIAIRKSVLLIDEVGIHILGILE